MNTDYGSVRYLADLPAYLFAEHTVQAGQAISVRCHASAYRTFLVLDGRVELHADSEQGGRAYGRLGGWHVLPGCAYRIACAGPGPAVLLEAGAAAVSPGAAGLDRAGCLDLSGYLVGKPWGSEVWYTHNVRTIPYALKRIQMTKGHQSSLQSHRYKAETNYVIDGEATVLGGAMAPDDLSALIETAKLTATVHRAGSAWTSPPGELHRVIARTDYTSIEVSTPELDDVIRWQDDTGRGNGRIESEHAREAS
jgi:quercetin dioxygenase-like cupin family protein